MNERLVISNVFLFGAFLGFMTQTIFFPGPSKLDHYYEVLEDREREACERRIGLAWVESTEGWVCVEESR